MKKAAATFLIIFSIVLLSACHHKPPQKAVPTIKRDSVMKQNEPDVFVPFSKDLYNKLKAANIDVKQVQFYIDQQVILSRYINSGKTEVTHGIVKFYNGRYIDEIVIPQYTPCVIDSVDYDGFRVNFGTNSNSFKFINSRVSTFPDNYVCSGTNWKDGSADLLYNKLVYRANCSTCGSLADVRLAVKQSDIDKSEKKTTILQGKKIGNY